MTAKPRILLGKLPRAAMVMAFVRSEDLARFAMQGQPIKAIARHLDRSASVVVRAIDFIRTFEAEIGRQDVAAVGAVVWQGQLGWERSRGFLEARGYIERGELMPKDKCGRKRKGGRRKPQPGDGTGPRSDASASASLPAPAAVPAAPSRNTGGGDSLLDELAGGSELLAQAARVASRPEGRGRA